MAKPNVISLYTGAGGLDYGFEAAGMRTVVGVEIDEVSVQTVRQNRRWPVIYDDISGVTTRRILAKAGLGRNDIDVLIVGPPCQPFSKSGYWATGSTKPLVLSAKTKTLNILHQKAAGSYVLKNSKEVLQRGRPGVLKAASSTSGNECVS
jgi:DNA (cytosine-5)-methyltransferase 1